MADNITIDPIICDLIPPLSPTEYANLENAIVADGVVREPLVTWNGTLYDGHHRLKIAEAHNIPYEVIEKDFANEFEALCWVFQNQRSRRNATKTQLAVSVVECDELVANVREQARQNQVAAGGKDDTAFTTKRKSAQAVHTNEFLAGLAGCSPDLMTKVLAVQKAGRSDLMEQMRAGELSATRAYNTLRREQKAEDSDVSEGTTEDHDPYADEDGEADGVWQDENGRYFSPGFHAGKQREVMEAWWVREHLGREAWDEGIRYLREDCEGEIIAVQDTIIRHLVHIHAKDADGYRVRSKYTDRYRHHKKINDAVFERWVFAECPDLRDRMVKPKFDGGTWWNESYFNYVDLYPDPYAHYRPTDEGARDHDDTEDHDVNVPLPNIEDHGSTEVTGDHDSDVTNKKKPHVAQATGQVEWYSPSWVVEAARKVMGGISLDPASSPTANETVKAERYYTKEQDGLSQPWSGRIFLNPPYAKDLIGRFADKLVAERDNYDQAVVLVDNATETAWFDRMFSVASAMCLPRKRVRFIDPDGNPGHPLQGQCVLYIGGNVAGFMRELSAFGNCVKVDTTEEPEDVKGDPADVMEPKVRELPKAKGNQYQQSAEVGTPTKAQAIKQANIDHHTAIDLQAMPEHTTVDTEDVTEDHTLSQAQNAIELLAKVTRRYVEWCRPYMWALKLLEDVNGDAECAAEFRGAVSDLDDLAWYLQKDVQLTGEAVPA